MTVPKDSQLQHKKRAPRQLTRALVKDVIHRRGDGALDKKAETDLFKAVIADCLAKQDHVRDSNKFKPFSWTTIPTVEEMVQELEDLINYSTFQIVKLRFLEARYDEIRIALEESRVR